MPKLKDILADLVTEIPGFLAVSIVGLDGLTLAANSIGNVDYKTVNTHFAQVVQLLLKTLNQLGKPAFDEFLVTTDQTYLLVRFIGSGSYWLGIAIDRKKGSLGSLRLIARQYADDIWNAIPRRKKQLHLT